MATIARQIRLSFDERVEQMGVTRAKWALLATVSRRPGATQREIAALLEISDVTAGRMIDKVCTDGMLERRASPGDRRAYQIFLTPNAQPILEKLGEAARSHEAQMLAGLDDAELEMLDSILDRITRNIAAARRDEPERRLNLLTNENEAADLV